MSRARVPFSRQYLATSDDPLAQFARAGARGIREFSVPAPRLVTTAVLQAVLLLRAIYSFCVRVFVCEPLFKAYCRSYGRNFHTGVFLHYVLGRGDIHIGDNVLLDGKSVFSFGARLSGRPVLTIGSNSGLGHRCTVVVARSVSIGDDCRIATGVIIFDSPGHPVDPRRRRRGEPPGPEDVRPVVIEDNVWVGRNAIIFPGVTIGRGSVVAAGAIVMSDVPPNTMVAGNPARRIAALEPEDVPHMEQP